MNVLVDTSVWSLALRRAKPPAGPLAEELTELIGEGRATVIGLIRQELLLGVPDARQFAALREHLRAFPDIPLDREDHEEAAAYFNRCRSKGVQGSTIDFLICATAARRSIPILTADGDFSHYARILPIRLHAPRR